MVKQLYGDTENGWKQQKTRATPEKSTGLPRPRYDAGNKNALRAYRAGNGKNTKIGDSGLKN